MNRGGDAVHFHALSFVELLGEDGLFTSERIDLLLQSLSECSFPLTVIRVNEAVIQPPTPSSHE